MSRIFKTKSKVSLRYYADFWHYLRRRKPKLTKATRQFCKLIKQNSGVRSRIKRTVFFKGYRIFDRLSKRLFRKKKKPDQPLTEILRNSARLRIYLGGMNKQHLKVLFKGFWNSKATPSRVLTSFELIIRCFLLRIHFIRSFREGKYFIKRGFFKINKKIIYNWNHRVNIGDIVSFSNLKSYIILIYVFFMLRLMLKARRIYWGVPAYILIDWRLLKAKMIRPIQPHELVLPYYHIDIFQAVRFCRKNL
jgi:hypothetical protein